MDITSQTLRDLFNSFSSLFNRGFGSVNSHWETVAMKVSSSTEKNTYGWLNDLPGIREWLGDRIVHRLSASSFEVSNKLFELTCTVARTKVEDDQYDFYGKIIEKMGADTAKHPDDLVFQILKDGFTKTCFDGQYYFDTDHKGYDSTGAETTVSNVTTGTEPAWYLLDCGQVLKPLLYQERSSFKFTQITAENDPHVFMRDEYIYGVRGRSNAGFGLWQLAYGSKVALNAANYEAARTKMTSQFKASGRPLGIMPTHLVVPPSLEGQGRRLLKSLVSSGETNEWAGSVELIVTPFVL